MSTPHINANKGDFAKTLLMPGDPLRAKYIADKFLSNVKEVSNVRNMLGFTGFYKEKAISVMGSGMGIPSCSIYAKELITEYDVKNIIRIGTCGAISRDINLRDIIIAIGASTDSKVNRSRLLGHDFSATASFELLEKSVITARNNNIKYRVGNVFSADLFYNPDPAIFDAMENMNILAVEMEAAGLYGCACQYRAKALTILTVSDHIRKNEATSADERQSSFDEMAILALESFYDV